jgi:hypothetical protein
MNLYESTVNSLREFKTSASHITALGKIRNASEDSTLNQALDILIRELQRFHASSKNKSTPASFASGTSTKNILAYCEQAIGSKKPEWQILAERHGWTPPAA